MISPAAEAVRTLVVWCPDWPVVGSGADPSTPVVVLSGGRVVACSEPARAEGVRRGQRLRDAQSRCPELHTYEADPDAEARLFERVVASVEVHCPRVEVVRPGICAVPVKGPARYFGGESEVAALLHEAVTGFDCRVGVADGMFTAVLAARAGPPSTLVPSAETAAFLADHPVNVLDRPELTRLLVRLGIHTLGEFAALPGDHVLARFGTDGAVAHRLARGIEPRQLAPRRLGKELSVSREFDPPVEQFEQVVFVAKSLADDLHAGLAGAGVSCVSVEVEVTTADGRSWSRRWRHDGLLSSTAVAERVRWQLDAWRTTTASDDDALTGGLTLLRLVPDQLVHDGGRQLALWGESVPDDRVDRAATRVQTMLGHAAVTQPVLGEGRGPAERVVKVPWGDVAALPAAGPWPGRLPPPAPSVVYPRSPVALLVDADGETVTVDGRCRVSAPPHELTVAGEEAQLVVGWTGPWPAHEYWWDDARRDRLVRFQVVTGDGQARLLVRRAGTWFVEGRY